jgi:hypothetical protein
VRVPKNLLDFFDSDMLQCFASERVTWSAGMKAPISCSVWPQFRVIAFLNQHVILPF